MKEIFERRSIRKYKDIEVEREKITAILKAAMQAPTACNQKEYEFIVVRDKEILKQLSACGKYLNPMGCCNVGIVVLANSEKMSCEAFWQQDLGAVTQNILLTVQELGLGAVWMGVAPIKERMDNVAKVLNLPPHIWPFNLIAIGYPDENRSPEDRFEQNRVHMNQY